MNLQQTTPSGHPRVVHLGDTCALRLELAGPQIKMSLWTAFAGGQTSLGEVRLDLHDVRRLGLCLRRLHWAMERGEVEP